jgi:uncharacterized protein (TIGR02646 family)
MKRNPLMGKVSKRYKLTAADKALLISNPPVSNDDWVKPVYKSLKESIRTYYSEIQGDHCAYCRTPTNFDGYDEHIEHIVDKKQKPQWMFEPFNLVLSCGPCNKKKGIKNTMLSSCALKTTVPKTSGCYNIIHPHIDKYQDHIIISDGLFYTAVTRDKGWNTITVCGLIRPQIVMKRALFLKFKNTKVESLIGIRISSQNMNKQEATQLKKIALAIIRKRNIK